MWAMDRKNWDQLYYFFFGPQKEAPWFRWLVWEGADLVSLSGVPTWSHCCVCAWETETDSGKNDRGRDTLRKREI